MVVSARNHGTLPTARHTTMSTATAQVLGPHTWPIADARTTATTAAATCCRPRENVR